MLQLTLLVVVGAQATVSWAPVNASDAGVSADQPVDLSALSPDDEASVERLGASFAHIEPPRQRARAIHDWLVTRLKYGAQDQSQAPAVVLSRRIASCDGYSALFLGIGRAAGLKVERIVGVARDAVGNPQSHAWNAVWLDGGWALVDVTFDDPQQGGALVGQDGYRLDYFLINPQDAALDHLPTDPRWLLGAKALTRTEFLAQGPDRVTARRLGLHVEFNADGGVVVDNPTGRFVLLRADGARCGPPTSATRAQLSCPVDTTRSHHFELFSHTADSGLFHSVSEWTR